MQKFRDFLFYLAGLAFIALALSLVYHARVEKLAQLWLLFAGLQDLLFALPVVGALALLWPLVFRTKSEQQQSVSPSALGFMVILFIFVIMGVAFAIQEFAMPRLYQRAMIADLYKAMKIKKAPKLLEAGELKLKSPEFAQMKFMPAKENIAFMMGNSAVYFKKLYKGNGAFFGEDFRMIAWNKNRQLDYIITSQKGKFVDTEFLASGAAYMEYKNGKMISSRTIEGMKRIPMNYQAESLYALNSDPDEKTASLIDIFLYTDYVFSSKINFYHLGNLIFNKLAYYLCLVLMLIIAASTGTSFRNARPIAREYFHTASFYVLSFGLTALLYDTLAALANMIYGIII